MIKKIFFNSIFFMLLFCSQRDLSNPFDPQNEYSFLNLDLLLEDIDSSVKISWTIPQSPNYKFAEIYKSEAGQDSILLAIVANNINFFIDLDVVDEVRYSYYLKLIGDDVESKITRPFSIITGPGDIWIVDDGLWEILNLNYDVENYSLRKYGYWKPKGISIAKNLSKGLITYPAFGYFEIFNLKNGNALYFNNTDLYPYDVVFDISRNHFWMVDSSGTLNRVDTNATIHTVSANFGQPVQIDIIENELYILDQKLNSIHIYNILHNSSTSITRNNLAELFQNLKLIRVDDVNGSLYILDEMQDGICSLYKYDIGTQTITSVISDTLILTFDVNPIDESIWIVTSNRLNFELVQHSNNGQRLLSVLKEFNRPRDVKVNPYNGNVILIDYDQRYAVYSEKVFHYKSTELVGTFKTYGNPLKAYIE